MGNLSTRADGHKKPLYASVKQPSAEGGWEDIDWEKSKTMMMIGGFLHALQVTLKVLWPCFWQQ